MRILAKWSSALLVTTGYGSYYLITHSVPKWVDGEYWSVENPIASAYGINNDDNAIKFFVNRHGTPLWTYHEE